MVSTLSLIQEAPGLEPKNGRARSIPQVLLNDLDAPPITLFDQRGACPDTLSREELVTGSAKLAAHFRDLGMETEDRVLFALPTGKAFIYSLMACWFNGAVSVPVAHRGTSKKPTLWKRILREIVRSAKPRYVIGNTESISSLRSVFEQPDGVTFIDESSALERARGIADPDIPPLPAPDKPAHIQFTSGSTGCPKGVLVQHRQIVENLHAAGERVGAREEDRFLSWLPLHHDMGFIGGLLFPIFMGIPQALVPTEAFLRAPQIWPKLISQFRATQSPAPTFAFELMATRVPEGLLQKASLDLSCWRYAWIGAEPIFPKTLSAFVSRFSRYGLQPNSLAPCYGLAEATLAVTASEPDTPPRVVWIKSSSLHEMGFAEPAREGEPEAVPVVGVGRPLEGLDLRIVDPEGDGRGEREEGRILLRGPCVAKQVLTTAGFQETEEWLDTGDLGFRIEDELYITGRAKDLLIRGGVNMHPHFVEKAAESIDGVRPGRIAAVSLFHHDSGRQEIVVLAEPTRYPPPDESELKRCIRQGVLEASGFQLDRVELVPPGTIPKTTSGKVQRGLAARQFASERFAVGDSRDELRGR
jgi:acyl-CoA synthetase (AMP-forming)/AMP-acid ligase II